MLKSLFGGSKEKPLPGASVQEQKGKVSPESVGTTAYVKFAVLRFQDGEQVLYHADDPFAKFYSSGNPNNIAFVEVPKEAVVKTENETEFKGGKVAATPFGEYPLKAEWVPDTTAERSK